ncbi:MAG: RNA methyltransferase [Bacteroidales bacterium]|nr:RNA methyltransferase [Bacteroidales bacterium]MBN2697176.1 RNA methyltransferase [Bacteroidales bacterium]
MRKLLNEELGRLDLDAYKTARKLPVVVVLDNIRSQNNIGSVFRTADAFRLDSIMLCGITATPPSKEIHKTALGATESVSWIYYERTVDAIRDLKRNDYLIMSVEQVEGGIMLESLEIDPGKKYAVVLGHEMRGVQQEVVDRSDLSIEIPQYGTKHSLNVAVAAGIVIWEMYRKMRRLF